MRSTCLLSRRWHQQFCRSPNFVSHQQCLQALYPRRSYRRLAKNPSIPTQKTTIGGRIEVQEFEKFKNDRITKGSIGSDVLAKEKESVEQELYELENELALLKEGPFGPKSELMRSLSGEEREKLLITLKDQGVSINKDENLISQDDLDDLEDLDSLDEVEDSITPEPGRLRVQLRVPLKDKVYVNRFNKALDAAHAENEDRDKHVNLWKWYLRCQQNVPNFSRVISEDVWRFLWKSQNKTYPQSKHIIVLAKDMMAVDLSLEEEQIIDYLRALHSNNDTATAMSLWEHEKAKIGNKSSDIARFWELGVELYASIGRPQKAQDVAFEAFDHGYSVNPRVFATVVSAWAQSQHPKAAEKLWYCYLQMRSRIQEKDLSFLGSEDKLRGSELENILGQISTVLLKAGRRDMALSVFRDMAVLQGRAVPDSWKVYREALGDLKNLNHSDLQEDDINQLGLAALVTFPKKFQNKFFFGSWIKWLIGEGRLDDAVLVVELMQERGLRPDARHLNGIIGAWFRNGSIGARDKAERLAWAMIHSRIDLVNSRDKAAQNAVQPLKEPGSQAIFYADRRKIPAFLGRHIPAATIETFSLLLLQYTRRSELSKAEYLTEVLCGPAQLKPNVFILNHWMYASLRGSDLTAVWNRYQSFNQDIEPDLETFTVLWDSAKANEDWFGKRHVKDFPSPRALFREMREWQEVMNRDYASEMRKSFNQDLYGQIIRCFCLSSDLRGVFCALRGLWVYFDLLPHEDIARMVIMQVARLLPPKTAVTSKSRKPLTSRRDSRYRASLREVAEIFESIREKNAAKKFDHGATSEEIEDPENEVAKRIRLDSLCDFILMVLERMLKPNPQAPNDIENQILTVATSMKIGKADVFQEDSMEKNVGLDRE